MELFNAIIRAMNEKTGKGAARAFPYDPALAWPDTKTSELVMLRDAAFELGGGSLPAVNLSCVTTDPTLVEKDEILLYGKDLGELKANTPFARVALVLAEGIDGADVDSESTFRAIQDIDFVKYHVFPKGYMVRTSSESNREQVRLGKDALKNGISFRRVGCDYIRKYHENPKVKAVKLLFITDPDADFAGMSKDAKSVHDITMTLSKILEGMPTDCSHCNLKPICDEVEGMKELHFGKNKK